MRRSISLLALCCTLAVALSAQAAIHRVSAGKAPFSAAVQAGDFIYVAGLGPNDENADIGTQTKQTLDNIAAALKKAGASLNDVVWTTVYVTQAGNVSGMDEAYAAAFKKNAPARALVVTGSLVGGKSLVEINAIAVRHGIARHAVLPKGWQKPAGPYSYAVKAANTLFISAVSGRNPADGSAAPANAGAQTKAVMDNIVELLRAGGMNLNDVSAARVWISDLKYYPNVNAVYRSYYSHAFPARATLQLKAMDAADLVQISAVAVSGAQHAVVSAINEDGSAAKPNPNYSAGMSAGNRMWVTGMTGETADNKTDVGAQTKETLARMLRVLKKGGFTPAQIVDVNVYLRDIKQWDQMNAAYREVFSKDLPVRTSIEADNAGHSLVEIVLSAAR